MESVYRVIRVIGSSPVSWEEAAKNAVASASRSLRDLRVAEIEKFDLKIDEGGIKSFRVRMSLSFKIEREIEENS